MHDTECATNPDICILHNPLHRRRGMLRAKVLIAGLSLWLGLATQGAEPMQLGARVDVASQPPDARGQFEPRVAFDGDGTCLVVWQQGRDFHKGQTADIYAARVSADGKALDDKPLAVCVAADSQFAPAVAFSNGVFLVAWGDLRNGKDLDLYAARVTSDGKVLDKDGFLIAGGTNNQCCPAVAPGEGNFLVVWQGFPGDGQGYALYGARVSPDGKTLDVGGVPLAGAKGLLRGGSASLMQTGKQQWFVFWEPPVPAYMGGGVARLAEKDGALAVVEANPALPRYCGRFGGSGASDGRRVLYAGPRSGRPGHALSGEVHVAMFDVDSCAPLVNPDKETWLKGVSPSVQPDKMIVVKTMNQLKEGMDVPATIARSGDLFLIAAKGSGGFKSDRNANWPNQIYGARIAGDGKMVVERPDAWQLLDDGAQPCANPALAGLRDGKFLLVYEADGGLGRHRVVARVVDATGANGR